MRKLQNGQAASRKKHSSVRRPLAPPIATGLPCTSFSASEGATAGDFNRMVDSPVLVAAGRGMMRSGANARVAAPKVPSLRNKDIYKCVKYKKQYCTPSQPRLGGAA